MGFVIVIFYLLRTNMEFKVVLVDLGLRGFRAWVGVILIVGFKCGRFWRCF